MVFTDLEDAVRELAGTRQEQGGPFYHLAGVYQSILGDDTTAEEKARRLAELIREHTRWLRGGQRPQ